MGKKGIRKMKLAKIKLINWHIFSDNVIDVKGNTLITGDNGNGKSTLIDAIFYVLSGGDEKCFNSAANDESTRTLTSYMRGKLGIEGKLFLRNDPDIISNISLEFYDVNKDERHVLGCIMSIQNSSKPKIKFFISLNSSIDSLNYASDSGEICDFKAFKSINANFDLNDLPDAYNSRRKQIAQFLNITNANSYYELLTKAIAFKPINSNVSDFVFKFLLKEDNIQIDSLAQELAEYKELMNTINREKDKLANLNTFIDKAKQYIAYKKDIEYLSVLNKEFNMQNLKSEIDKSEKKVIITLQKIQDIEVQLTQLNEKLIKIENEIITFENKDELKIVQEKNSQLDNLKQQEQALSKTIEEVENALTFEMDIMPCVNLSFNFLDDISKGNIVLLNKHITEYISEIEKEKEKLRLTILEKNKQIATHNTNIYQKNKELYLVSQGKNNYDFQVRNLIDILKQELKRIYKEDVVVLPLCECVEIVDKEWANAIEGYLNTQRFDLILEPRYYSDAVDIYEKFAHERNIYGVGIVNTQVIQKANVAENSLFTKVEVLNSNAEAICQRILGSVVCVDDVRKFIPHKTCITKTCMVYKNDITRAINPKVYAIPFIGESSIIKRKEILNMEIEAEKLALNKEEKELKEVKRRLDILNYSKLKGANIDNHWAKLKNIKQSIVDLQNDITELSKQHNIVQLSNLLDELKRQKTTAQESYSTLIDDKRQRETELLSQKTQKLVSEQKLSEIIELYNSAYESLQDKNEFELFKEDVIASGKDPLLEFKRREQVINNIIDKVKSGMKNYVTEFNSNLSYDIECINDFITEFNNINDRGIINQQTRATEVFENACKQFNDNFISVLRTKIETAKLELDRINATLKRHPFGRDEEVYEFKRIDSNDRDMREYARIIMSGNEINQKDLFTETLNPRDREIMQELFDKLANISNATQAEKDLHKYLDYRQYYQYDIIIKNKKKQEMRFSSIHKEKSGGEMQTPFYVVIGACFDELTKHDERTSSACIVAFDEAFNNMDEPRIITLMNYYKKLQIQLLIAVPTNHSQGLIPYVDTAISLIKKDDNVYETYLINE